MKYFAYGSNMSSEEMRAWCPSAQFVAAARLPHHRLDFTRYSRKREGGVADIVPARGQEVWGVLYELDAGDLAALDRKEGVPAAYTRAFVDVAPVSGEPARVLTYTVVEKGRTEAPSREYLEIMLRGARERDLPGSYVRTLEQIASRDAAAATEER